MLAGLACQDLANARSCKTLRGGCPGILGTVSAQNSSLKIIEYFYGIFAFIW